MPSTTLSFRRILTAEQKSSFADAVHAAMVESLKIPQQDKLIRILELSDNAFFVSNASDQYVIVEISLFAGRSIDAKRDLYKNIVNRFSELAVPKDEIRIILYEVPAENWGLRGGQAGCDISFDYKVDV